MKTTLVAGLLFVAFSASVNATQWVVRWGDAPRDIRGYSRTDRHMGRRMPAGSGYWAVVNRLVYRPGYWHYWQHPCGSYQRRWIPAESRMVPQRVWIPACGPIRGAWR